MVVQRRQEKRANGASHLVRVAPGGLKGASHLVREVGSRWQMTDSIEAQGRNRRRVMCRDGVLAALAIAAVTIAPAVGRAQLLAGGDRCRPLV